MSITLPDGIRRRRRVPGFAPISLAILVAATAWIATAARPTATANASTTVDWTQFRESQTHQGNNPEVGTALTTSTVSDLSVAWTGQTGGAVDSSPATTAGLVYVGSSDGYLYVYASGCGTLGAACTPIWKGATGGAITSSPAVASGYVFVGSADGKLYAFHVGCGTGGATCSPTWTGTTGGAIDSSPSVDQSVVYVGSADGKLYAFTATGCGNGVSVCAPVWKGTTGGAIHSSPAATNGYAYVGSDDGKLYVFSTTCGTGDATCTPVWTATTGGAVRSSPSIASGRVYVGSNDGTFYAFDAAGSTNCGGSPVVCTPLWTGVTGGPVTASASEGLGRVWIASEDGKLYSFTNCGTSGAACTPQWTANVGHAIDSSPAYSDDVLYIGASDGKVYAFQADCPTSTCSALWSASIGTAVKSSPTVTTGFVYVGSSDGRLYAFHLPVDHLVLTPSTASVPAGGTQAYKAEGYSVGNQDQGDLTVAATFSISGGGTCTFSTCGALTPGDYTVTATYGTATGTAMLTVTSTNATFVPLTPQRILDTRNGTGLNSHFRSHVARTFQVTGQGGVPSNAVAVTGNLTVTQQSTKGYLYIGPNAVDYPTSSSLNFPSGDDRANGVDVALGAGGTLSVTFVSQSSTATAQVIFDVSGYFIPNTTGATFHALTPARLLDTRNGTGLTGQLHAHAARTFQVTGLGGVPSNATAVTGNLTVTRQATNGFLYVGPTAANDPTSSTVNFPLGDDRANNVTIALGAGGTLALTYVSGRSSATADAVFDVTGYFTQDTTGAMYVPVTPTRLLDTRPGGTGLSGVFTSHVARSFQVTGGLIPANAIAVTGNLTVTQQSQNGYLYLGPDPVNYPTSSTLNFPRADDRANGVTVALGGSGTLSVTYVAGHPTSTAQVIFDVSGYFAP